MPSKSSIVGMDSGGVATALLGLSGGGLLLREGGLGGLGGGSGGGGGVGLAWRSTTGARQEKLIFFTADQSSSSWLINHPPLDSR